MTFEEEMQTFDEQWEADAAGGGQLPDGTYTEATLVESKVIEQTERYVWLNVFESALDVGGSTTTGRIQQWNNLDSEIGRSIAAQNAARLGYTGKLSGLMDACEKEQFVGLVCEIVVKTKPGTERDFTNVYINKVQGVSAGTATPRGGPLPDDSDIPF